MVDEKGEIGCFFEYQSLSGVFFVSIKKLP